MDQEHSISRTIAEKVKSRGGQAFYVGGCVRDKLLRKAGADHRQLQGLGNEDIKQQVPENEDIDIEVHGIEPEELFSLLKEVGEPVSFGASFGIYSLKGHNIDIAMPRREHTGIR